MTSLSPDFFKEMGINEQRARELEEQNKVIAKSYALFEKYRKKELMERYKRTLSGDVLLQNSLAIQKNLFFEAFENSKNVGLIINNLFDKTLIKGLDEQINKDLKGYDEAVISTFINKLCLSFELSEGDFMNDFLVRLVIQSRLGSIFSLEHYLVDIHAFNKYLYYIVFLVSENCPTSDIFYFIDKTASKKCSGCYVELFKRFVFLINDNFSIESEKTMDVSEDNEELLVDFASLIGPQETISKEELMVRLINTELEMDIEKVEHPHNSLIDEQIKLLMS